MSDRPANPAMRFCPYCGNEVQPTFKFCAFCGASLVAAANVISDRQTDTDANLPPEPSGDALVSTDRTTEPVSPYREHRRTTAQTLTSAANVLSWSRRYAALLTTVLDRVQDWPPRIEPPRFLATEFRIGLFARNLTFSAALAAEILIVFALTVLAAWMRVEGLVDPSPGINIDESTYAAEINRIVGGEWIGKFSGASLGVPTLQFYLTAPLFLLLDSELFAIRIVSVLAGTLIVPVAYVLMRRFFSFTTSVVTTTLIAFSIYFMLESRIGWPLMLAVFELLLGLTLLVISVERRIPWLALIAGIVVGAGMYTHQVFLPYWFAIIVIAVALALIHPPLRHRRELFLFAATCFLTGINMAWFLVFDFDWAEDLESHYGVSATIDFVRYAQRGLEVFMFFRSPISADFTDAAPSAPIFAGVFQVFFLIGCATTILRIKDHRYQMLAIGYLVAMIPSVIVPGSEARRFMVGIFFMSAFVGVGFNVVIQLLVAYTPTITGASNPKVVSIIRRSAYVAVVLLLVTATAWSGYNRLDEWKSKDARWTFNYDLTLLSNFLKDFDENYTVHLYSDRSHTPHPIIDWVAPHLNAIDGTEEQIDGQRVLTLPEPVRGPILVALLESYIDHAPELRDQYPHAEFEEFVDEYGRVLWSVFVFRDL